MTGRRPVEVESVTVAHILRAVIDYRRIETHHGDSHSCPGCNADLTVVALVSLAYVFDTCACGNPSYAHLVEQLWHRDCLQREGSAP